jgi:transcriptional regulator with XRE-family HTH domain
MARKHVSQTFEFTPALGARLKALRERAGLTQDQLSRRMGRLQKSSGRFVSRLEQGKRRFPSIALIADYLRACRADFKDIGDILSAYTSFSTVTSVSTGKALVRLVEHLPVPVQQEVLKYERRTSRAMVEPARQEAAKPKKKRELTEQERLLRIVLMFSHAYQRRVLEDRLYQAMKSLGSPVPVSKRKATCEYGRRVFGAMKRFRKDALRRWARLQKLEHDAIEQGLDRAAVDAMTRAGIAAYEQLEKEGRLDWQPTPEEFVELRKGPFTVIRAEAQLDMEAAGMSRQYNKARYLFETLIALDVNRELSKQRIDTDILRRIYTWVMAVLETAIEKGVDAARQKVEDDVPRSRAPDLYRLAADKALLLLDQRRHKLPVEPKKKT